MRINLRTKDLKAMLLTAGKLDIRYYLNGLCVNFRPGMVRLISTDGPHMSILKLNYAHVIDHAEVIIPRAAIEELGKNLITVLEKVYEGWTLDGRAFTPINHKYPEFQRAVPDKTSSEPAHLDPELLVHFKKMAKMMHDKKPGIRLSQNGKDQTLVTMLGTEDFIGTISPLNLKCEATKQSPSWSKLP